MHTLGVSRPGRWWELSRHQELMKQIKGRYGHEVLEQIQPELDRYLEMIQMLEKKLGELTAQLCQSAQQNRRSGSKGSGI